MRRESDYTRSTMTATASPPPMHSVARPVFLLWRLSAYTSVVRIRAPLHPIGWPSDAAPPFNRGKHEELFGSLMDQAIATRIVRSSNFPIVDRVAEQLLAPPEKGERG